MMPGDNQGAGVMFAPNIITGDGFMALFIPYSEELSAESERKIAEFNGQAGTLFTLKEAAAILRVSVRTLQRWIAAGEIEAFRIGSRWRVPAGSIAKLMQSGGGDPDGQG